MNDDIMSSNLPYKQVKNVERRTWDKKTYTERAEARSKASLDDDAMARKTMKRPLSTVAAALTDNYDKEEFIPADSGAAGPLNSKRSFLKARRERVDIDSKLGSVEIINPEKIGKSSSGVSIKDGVTASANGIGWHCTVCDCWLRDSITYVDHINGKKHQRYLGYSMRVGKSSNDQVKNKLAELAKLKKPSQPDLFDDSQSQKQSSKSFPIKDTDGDKIGHREPESKMANRVNDGNSAIDADENDKSYDEEDSDSDDIAAIMGFKGFK